MSASGWRVLVSIFIGIILISSSLENFQNFSPKSNQDVSNFPEAFAQNSPTDITRIGSYVVFGLQSVEIDKGVTIVNGSLGVQGANSKEKKSDDITIDLDKGSKFLDPSSVLVGDSIEIEKGATAQNVFYNHLKNEGTILGTKNTPLQTPVVKFLPPVRHSTPGTKPINVPKDASLTLQPGVYGTISIAKSATLNFAGGIYNVTSINAKENAKLLFVKPSQVMVQKQIDFEKGVQAGPASPSIRAHDIVLFVDGDAGTIRDHDEKGYLPKINIGKNDRVYANIFSSTGIISMDEGVKATGSFIAKTIKIGEDSTITFDSAFALPVITWTPSSLSVQAKPFAPALLNFTASSNATNVGITVSSQISKIVAPAKTTLTTIDSTSLQSLLVITSIPPGTTSGWHNGTINLTLDGVTLQNSFNMNIFVPAISSKIVQTSTGNFTYIATPSLSTFFPNAIDISTFFTFTNGTTIPIRTYYDVFTRQNTITPISYHEPTNKPDNLINIIYNYFGAVSSTFSNLLIAHKDSAANQPAPALPNLQSINTLHGTNIPDVRVKQPAEIDSAKLSMVQMPFIENSGQTDKQVRFYANTFAGTVFVTDYGMTYSLTKDSKNQTKDTHGTVIGEAIRERFIAGNRLHPAGIDRSSAVANYFVGKKESWHSNVPTYDTVSLGQVWPHVDVELHVYGKNMEKIFKVGPGASLDKIKVGIDGIKGLKVDNDGKLLLQTELGTVSMTKPLAYQEISGVRKAVQVSYVVNDKMYGFVASNYDPRYTLVVDPLLASTFLGGSVGEVAYAIALDSSNNVYVAGETESTNFPTTAGAYQTTYAGGQDIFISKLDSSLSSLKASTYLGGSSFDQVQSVALDSSGNVYVAGFTTSSDFPITAGAYQTTSGGGFDCAFVSKMNNDLTSLVASTYLGGSNSAVANAMVLDSSGNVYLVGGALSSDFPTTAGAYQTTLGGAGASNAFVSKIDSNLSSLLASTFLGGSVGEVAYAIALDSSDNVYVAGNTGSTNFPTTAGAYQTTLSGGLSSDAFISKLDSNLSSLLASTFLGGSGGDGASAIALDSSGNVYVAGNTGSTNFPTTAGAYQTTLGGAGASNAFVSKLDSNLSSLLASTFLGGSGGDEADAMVLDSSGKVYVDGRVASTNFPTTAGAYQTTLSGGLSSDAFISKLDSNLSSLLASTFLGGSTYDSARAITLDSSGNIYIAGQATSKNFPTTAGAYQTTLVSGGGKPGNVFVSKLTGDLSAVVTDATCTKYTITYHYTSTTSTVASDLSVASNALNVDAQHPLIVRNDISWNVVENGSLVKGVWKHSSWNNGAIDNYFKKIPAGTKVYVILGTHSPPDDIALAGSPFPGSLQSFGKPLTHGQFMYQNETNQFIQHTVSYIVSNKTYLDKIAYWQIDNEPNTHPVVDFKEIPPVYVADWGKTASALKNWVQTVKSLDPTTPIVINMYQANPNDIVPDSLADLGKKSGVSYVMEPFTNLLTPSGPVGTALMSNVEIAGFDIYPDHWAYPIGNNAILTGFNGALNQIPNQLMVASSDNFVGRWGVPEMAGGPKAPAPLPFLPDSLTTIPTISPTDVSNMIISTQAKSFNGAPPALIGLFQLTAPNVFNVNLLDPNRTFWPPFAGMYGLITSPPGQDNDGNAGTQDFVGAIKNHVKQNCLGHIGTGRIDQVETTPNSFQLSGGNDYYINLELNNWGSASYRLNSIAMFNGGLQYLKVDVTSNSITNNSIVAFQDNQTDTTDVLTIPPSYTGSLTLNGASTFNAGDQIVWHVHTANSNPISLKISAVYYYETSLGGNPSRIYQVVTHADGSSGLIPNYQNADNYIDLNLGTVQSNENDVRTVAPYDGGLQEFQAEVVVNQQTLYNTTITFSVNGHDTTDALTILPFSGYDFIGSNFQNHCGCELIKITGHSTFKKGDYIDWHSHQNDPSLPIIKLKGSAAYYYDP